MLFFFFFFFTYPSRVSAAIFDCPVVDGPLEVRLWVSRDLAGEDENLPVIWLVQSGLLNEGRSRFFPHCGNSGCGRRKKRIILYWLNDHEIYNNWNIVWLLSGGAGENLLVIWLFQSHFLSLWQLRFWRRKNFIYWLMKSETYMNTKACYHCYIFQEMIRIHIQVIWVWTHSEGGLEAIVGAAPFPIAVTMAVDWRKYGESSMKCMISIWFFFLIKHDID